MKARYRARHSALNLAATFLAGSVVLAVPQFVLAQAWPQKPIRAVVPYAPGGGTDIMARLVSNRLGTLLGQPVIIENRGGAGGAIGSDLVAAAPADGYTIMYTPGSDLLMRKYLTRSPHADAVRDFTPIAVSVMSVASIVARPSAPYKTAREMLDYVKRNPNKVTFASPGINSNFHLAGELLRMLGYEFVHVPYKGSGPSVPALISGEVDTVFSNLGTVIPLIKDGRARAIAMFDDKRYPGLPDTPSLVEVLPGFNLPSAWFGWLGPARLPAPIAARLHDELDRAFNSPEIKPKIEEQTVSVISRTQAEFAAMVREGVEIYANIVTAAKIQPE